MHVARLHDRVEAPDLRLQKRNCRSIQTLRAQPAGSHSIRRLEDRLGVKLRNGNSRSVSLPNAGKRLIDSRRPSFRQLGERIAERSSLGVRPSGEA